MSTSTFTTTTLETLIQVIDMLSYWSGSGELCFVIKHNFLIFPEFIQSVFFVVSIFARGQISYIRYTNDNHLPLN